MKLSQSSLTRSALRCTAFAMLAGCGGLQPPIGAPGVGMPQSTARYMLLYSFKGHPDGFAPFEGLSAVNGMLYGTTFYGGAHNYGIVFAISTSGSEQVLHSFGPAPDGEYPSTTLLAWDGTLYGTTMAGGSKYDSGTVFDITPSGSESVLHSFGNAHDGSSPVAGLIASNGTFYSTTISGGIKYNNGTVFDITPSGPESVLYSFDNIPDGAFPNAPVIAVHQKLYGTTFHGGSGGGSCSDGCGTVFEVSKSGVEQVLYSFKGSPDGASPESAGLIFTHGALYGTTENGGTYNQGCVFRVTLSGSESIVYSFKGAPDGAVPDAGLLYLRGQLYGTTTQGGADSVNNCYPQGCGTVFRVSLSGNESVLYRFRGTPDGWYPSGQLIDVDRTLYGTTADGGTSDDGTVFSVRP
jgi:uncharacterized repeat protein (TIGR03803 family)